MTPPMPTAGNAAANTQNLLDLKGANVSPPPLPAGFQAKGIVAMTFSIIAGLIGVGVIAWYGIGEMSQISKEHGQQHIDKVAADRGVVSRVNTDISTSPGAQVDQITTAARS